MDTALEDKICDLYDLFVDVQKFEPKVFILQILCGLKYVLNESYLQLFQGLDENSGPQIRKLYAEVVQIFYAFLSIFVQQS